MTHFSLLELNQLVRNTLDGNLEPSYWVVAEIGDFRVTQKGHCYLELVQKEGDNVVAKAKGTIWAYTFRNLRTWFEGITGRSLQTGLKLLLNVNVQFHELYGFSLNVRDIDADYTLGEKERRRKEIIEKIKKEGLFEANKSCFLPLVPQSLAVISSPTAAGYGDFTDHLENNPYGYKVRIKLFRSIMQGEEAVVSMQTAFERIASSREDFDVVVIIRGGGSQAELDCFDDYDLAVAIAKCPIPVITGIGHERDETIADLVAHTQLKTPTAVSEFLLTGFMQFESSLNEQLTRLQLRYERVIREQELILSDKYHHLRQHALARIEHQKNRFVQVERQLETLSMHTLQFEAAELDRLTAMVQSHDPENVLKRGYTISLVDGVPLGKAKAENIREGQSLTTRSAQMEINSVIKQVKEVG